MTRKEIEAKIEALEERIDELDHIGYINDTDEYLPEIKALEEEIYHLKYMDADPEEFTFEVTITGTVTVKAETEEEARAIIYGECKNHDFIAVQSVEAEEE